MIYSLFIVAFIALICGSFSFVSGRSTGAPICRATQITDVSGGMTGATVDPSTDYSFKTFLSGITSYIPNQPLVFTIDDDSASLNPTFKGILAFAEKSDQTQVGIFTNPDTSLYTFTGNFPAACNDKKTAITHSSPTPKDLPLNLTWTAPAAGTGPVTVRVALYTTGNRLFKFFTVALTEGVDPSTTTTTTTTAPATTTTTTTAAGTTTTTTAAGTTTTTTAAGTTTTTTAAGTTTTTVAPSGNTTTTTKAPGNSTTTTQKPTSAATQYGPVFMVIGTMMAMGLAFIGF